MITAAELDRRLTMHLLNPTLAAVYTDERLREADRSRLAAQVMSARRPRISLFRRTLAHALVAVSRASAAAVRRLDACLADDLGRSLSPGDGA
jgi:hypothetical protein